MSQDVTVEVFRAVGFIAPPESPLDNQLRAVLFPPESKLDPKPTVREFVAFEALKAVLDERDGLIELVKSLRGAGFKPVDPMAEAMP